MTPDNPQKQASKLAVSTKTPDHRTRPVWFCVVLDTSLPALLTQGYNAYSSLAPVVSYTIKKKAYVNEGVKVKCLTVLYYIGNCYREILQD
jgi:hypothetical protein